jgi:prepilin-type N-terminal cleavage/methylation domain-containing protein
VHRGFSLIEVLFATAIMTVATIVLAQLSVVAVNLNRGARSTTLATVLASQKMEQLQALVWTFDANGAPRTDTTTDTSVVPHESSGGTGLAVSPDDALTRNVVGYCDFVDRVGGTLGGGVSPPAGSAFVRRWSIKPGSAADVLVVQIVVIPIGDSGRVVNGPRHPEEVRIVGIKTRTGG